MKKITFGPAEMGILAVSLLVAGIVGYQFTDINGGKTETVANAEQEVANDQTDNTSVSADEVSIPQEQKPIEKVDSTVESDPESDGQEEPKLVNMTVSAQQIGQTVEASAVMDQSLTGTCTFIFAHAGYADITKRTTISNNDSCSISAADYEFNVVGEWQVGASFASTDRLYAGEATALVVID